MRSLLGGAGGLAQAVTAVLDANVSTGGPLDAGIAAADRASSRVSKQIADMDRPLSQRQALMKQQFAAMESALQASHAQGDWLAAQLGRLQQR